MARTLVLALLLLVNGVNSASQRHLRELQRLVDTPGASVRRQLAPSCSVEPGVDYVDNDIGSESNLQASDCCGRCQLRVGCGAWSWSAWNGGTCWFKSIKGQTVSNPAVQSAVLSTAPSTCHIAPGIDYIDNDIANVRAAPASECCYVCMGTPGCKAFSWTNLNGGTCWLKSAKGQTRSDPNVQSCDLFSTSSCALELGVDYVDNDLGSSGGHSSPDECCFVCKTWVGCRAFSWTALNGGTCWLKSRMGARRYDPNVVSSSIFPNLPACAIVEKDVDYVDNDIASVKNGDANNCCDICRNWGGGNVCWAFAWSSFNGGTCWLKSAKGPVIAKAGVISGVIY